MLLVNRKSTANYRLLQAITAISGNISIGMRVLCNTKLRRCIHTVYSKKKAEANRSGGIWVIERIPWLSGTFARLSRGGKIVPFCRLFKVMPHFIWTFEKQTQLFVFMLFMQRRGQGSSGSLVLSQGSCLVPQTVPMEVIDNQISLSGQIYVTAANGSGQRVSPPLIEWLLTVLQRGSNIVLNSTPGHM